MNYYISTELYHHGIKGQRWGIRRYQNYDGSYTQAGLKRYNTAKQLRDIAEESYESGKISRAELGADRKNERRAYKQLKNDYSADKGRELRRKGSTITGNSAVQLIATNAGIVGGG